MSKEFPCAPAASADPLSISFVGDDATSADQIALAVVEILGKRVVTIDAESCCRCGRSFDASLVRVINTAARALPQDQADAQNQCLARTVWSSEKSIPVVQIDSRLRGIGKALRGIYDSLEFDFLLFVPAEPELARLVHESIFCHVEAGRRVLFHQSTLVNAGEAPAINSDLRAFIAAELGVPVEHVASIHEELVSQGPESIAKFIHGLRKQGKIILIPDITKPEHFDALVQAEKQLKPSRVLIAGSRTFIRSYLASLGTGNTGIKHMTTLSQAINRQKRGAPLALISSLEPAMNEQIAYAQRALGPNLVTVDFDSNVVLGNERDIQQEIDRATQLVCPALKAMRPVLLQTSRTAAFTDPAVQQKHLDALSQIITNETIQKHLTAVFISGGQTAETVKKTLGICSVEIKGAFQESIPWGVPSEGPLHGIPLVTKGGRMGNESVLHEFLDQAHPLPRANVLPVVTPLTKNKEIDEAGIEKLIAHLLRLGTTDIFAVGNAGEFRFLRNEQRLEAIDIFVRKAQGRLRVFAGITGDTAEETRDNYEAVGKLGAYAAVVMPLYFLNSSDEIAPFVESLSAVTPSLPLILYNNPERTNKQNIAFEAVEALKYPVVAIKDSSGDLDRVDRYALSMTVYEGQQRQFWEGYQHGVRGAIGIIGHISSLPNEFFAPTTTVDRRKVIAGQINDLSKVAKQGGAEVAAYKYILSLLGVMGDTVASNEPARELTAEQRELIRANNAEMVSTMQLR